MILTDHQEGQVRALLAPLAVLSELGARHIIGERCAECEGWAFGSLDDFPGTSVLLVCAYCGADWLSATYRPVR